MKQITLSFDRTAKPRYLAIAQALRQAIRQGVLVAGEMLPSARALAEQCACHRHTIMAAYNELVAEGWIVGKERSAYRVIDTLPDHFFVAQQQVKSTEQPAMDFAFARQIETADLISQDGFTHRFQSGLPDLRCFPKTEFKSCWSDAFKHPFEQLLGYSDCAGHALLRQEIATYLRRVRSVVDRDILITHGSQEAIFMVGQLLLTAGDQVAVEGLGYPPAWEALRASGAELVGIPVDQQGMEIDALATQLKKGKIKLIYTTPLHQYPTTVTLPIDRRLALYDLAAQYQVPILEDDYDHEFHYRSQPLAPLAAHDPCGLVIYASTFSKVLYPSARCGFMALPKKLFGPLVEMKRIISRQNDTLLQLAIALWMQQGGLDRHMRKMRRLYETRRDAMAEALRHYALDWHLPDGGMAIWVNCHQDTQQVADSARQNHVYVMPETQFRLDGQPGTHLRLGFANQTPEEAALGLSRVMQTQPPEQH